MLTLGRDYLSTWAETTYPHGLDTRLFWGTRATNFPIYTTKMKGAGPQILGTGAKFKRVPCQKSCRVNRALDSFNLLRDWGVKRKTVLSTHVTYQFNS